MGEDRWGIPDRWAEKLLKATDAPVKESEAYIDVINTDDVDPDDVNIGGVDARIEAEKKKCCVLKRPRLSTKEELSRKEEGPQQSQFIQERCIPTSSLERIPISTKKRCWADPISAGSSNGIPITTERRHAVVESPLMPEGSMGPLLLEGIPRVVVIEEEGDLSPTLTSMEDPEFLVHLRVLVETFGEPSSSKSDEEVPRDVEGRGLIELNLRKLLPHAEYRYHVLGKSAPLAVRDLWFSDLFGVSPIMDADER
ncbi:hypothetical protein ACLOJK_004657 [Asimina triloba]